MENGLIKINSRGGARAFYVTAINKWTGVKGTYSKPAAPYLASQMCHDESGDSYDDQCRKHTKQLSACKQRFEDVRVKPMRTIDCRGWGEQHSYGVANYAALGWS